MYELIHADKNTGARAGKLMTGHGIIETPAFMPVATKATVKTLTPEELCDMGTQALISNAFHLLLAPGMEVIQKASGLHKFMHWKRAIFTDSGGLQMIRKDSLSRLRMRESLIKIRVTGRNTSIRLSSAFVTRKSWEAMLQ